MTIVGDFPIFNYKRKHRSEISRDDVYPGSHAELGIMPHYAEWHSLFDVSIKL